MTMLEKARRRSEPLLRRLLAMTGPAATATDADALGETKLEPVYKLRQQPQQQLTTTKQPTLPLKGHERILLTWREITTGSLLLCAFGACTAVFVLLNQQGRSTASSSATTECEARNALHQKLLSFMTGDNHTASSALSLLAEGVSVSANAMDITDEGSACSYNIQVCPHSQNDASPEDEAIMYMLLVGALLTVLGVTVLLYDDNEEAMLKMVSSEAGDSSAVVGGGMPRRGSMNSSELMWGSENRRMGNADLFPDSSVLFADIVGFEAWSSQRAPTQCLTLLETIYDAFDRIARSQGIFKVESVADCYTAATGLPEPRPDHAEAMIRFAHDCLKRFKETTTALEVTLGPDTSDLGLRIGIHSGPVTAIRRRSRFQLFGDTVSSANSIMITSRAGRIQLSQETVNLLPAEVRTDWVSSSEGLAGTKGDQGVVTYWVRSSALALSDESKRDASSRNADAGESETDRIPRLVDWNVQILKRALNQMAAQRYATQAPSKPVDEDAVDKQLREGKLVIDEVELVVKLPKYDAALARAQENQISVEVSDQVVEQLRDYIMTIAQSYKSNPFHNFEHASHVTMSVSKLLSRILAPKLGKAKADKIDKLRHDHTYGITSDPLTQFACIFSALIHDAEHEGVPNAQLIQEETALAAKYKNQSVAEQNSVDVGWNLLMAPRFKELRSAIYNNEAEMIRFRQLVVNCVMATDICDKQLKELRNNRWDRAFKAKTDDSDPSQQETAPDPAVLEEDVNRKATIVIEHLLQASDVSHTMQHFSVFKNWNEKLFMEMYFAFRDGRSAADPSTFWYKGEIGFFDFYIIPLAKKLKECGVFCVSSDEYLNYATKNRQEWELKGRDVVEALIEKGEQAYARREGSSEEGGKNCKLAPSA